MEKEITLEDLQSFEANFNESKVNRVAMNATAQAGVLDAAKNYEFAELHHYYTTRKQNPLKKMQSLMVVAEKLIRVFYVILTKGVDYDPKKMTEDIKRPHDSSQAAE